MVDFRMVDTPSCAILTGHEGKLENLVKSFRRLRIPTIEGEYRFDKPSNYRFDKLAIRLRLRNERAY